MAGGYDGEIRIRTLIENGKASSQLLQLEAKFQKLTSEAKKLSDGMREIEKMKIPTEEYKNLQGQFDALVAKGKKLSEELKNTEKFVPSKPYLEAEKALDSVSAKQDHLRKKMEEWVALGKKTNSVPYKKMEMDFETLGQQADRLIMCLNEMDENGSNREISDKWKNIKDQMAQAGAEASKVKAQMRDMESDGTANVDPKSTAEYQKKAEKLKEVNRQLDVTKRKMEEVAAKEAKVGSGSKNIEKVGKAAKKSAGLMSTLLSRLKGITLSLFVFNWITKGFNAMVAAFKEGIQNMAKYSGDFNSRMSELKTATATLKASLGALAAPIVSAVVPALVTLCNWLTTAVNKFNELIAALSGKSTWTKAKKQQVDYAKSLDGTAGAAKKTAGALAAFDDLNVLQKNDTDSGESGGADTSTMYEEVPTSDTLVDKLQPFLDYLKGLKDEVIRGWNETWAALDIDSQIADMKRSIESIKGSLADIFGSADVQTAADNFFKTLSYNIGRIGASIVSVGATIGQNILGGIALYLEENSGRIQEYLVNMFNIGADVAQLAGDAAEAFAYVFQAFGGENGQQLTANLLGIFTGAFAAITETVALRAQDILNVIVQPFVDNQEGFRTALDGFLGTAATVCGTIKETIDNTFDKLMEVYDEHIHPFFQSIADGLSTITGKFLEFWNTYVQPVMDQLAEKFDSVMAEHIQPLIDKALELLGSVSDFLKAFWEEVLVPFISWVIENILPVILPIIQDLYDGFMDFVGYIADAISGLIKVIKGIIDFVTGVFTGDWKKAWNAVSDIVTGIMETISAVIKAALTAVKTVVKAKLDYIAAFFKTIFKAIHDYVKFVMSKIKTVITTIMGHIKSGISTVLTNVKKTWTTIWTSMRDVVVNIFKSIWSGIKGVINSIIGGIEKMANSVISGLNSMINAMNKLSWNIPDWVPVIGGNQFGLSISTIGSVSIPRLANGGITTGSTLANIGEAGREAVLPLENNLSYLEPFADMIAEKIPPANNAPVYLQVDGKTFARLMNPYSQAERNRIGLSFT